MDEPLWIDDHAPGIDDLPQSGVRDRLRRAAEEPMNLVVHGPSGVGKTAAVRAMAGEAHDDPDNDLVIVNVADFFGRTKSEIREDPRFANFLQGQVPWTKGRDVTKYKREWSKRDMINHVIREFASYSPASGDYKTLLLDNAETVREDFQQALRRMMERHQGTTQFVLATRQPSKLIPAIRSRCVPVAMRSPTTEETVSILADVADAEGADYDDDGLEYVAGYAGGDLRKAILGAQTTYEDAGEITMTAAYDALGDVGPRDRIEEMLADAEGGAFADARSTLDDLLLEEGYDGDEVLAEILAVGRSRYAGDDLARLHRLAGEVDLDLAAGTNDRLHVGHLLAELAE